MTSQATAEPSENPDPAADAEAVALLSEVRDSVLRLVAELPTSPGLIRVSVRDIAMELSWSAAADAGPPSPIGPPSPTPAVVAGRAALAPAEAGQAPSAEASDPRPGLHTVTSAMVGTFYRAPEPGAAPFVKVGDMVQPGRQLAIVEAMKLMIPVEADVSGRITEVLKDDGKPVEYGEPLLVIERA